jgi:hypothetical protein
MPKDVILRHVQGICIPEIFQLLAHGSADPRLKAEDDIADKAAFSSG